MGQLGDEVAALEFLCQALDTCPSVVLMQQQIERLTAEDGIYEYHGENHLSTALKFNSFQSLNC
jgi:hypothetical protein